MYWLFAQSDNEISVCSNYRVWVVPLVIIGPTVMEVDCQRAPSDGAQANKRRSMEDLLLPT